MLHANIQYPRIRHAEVRKSVSVALRSLTNFLRVIVGDLLLTS